MIPINIALNPEAAIQRAVLDMSPVLTFPVDLFRSAPQKPYKIVEIFPLISSL
jgi:hypothetical protein